MSTTKFTAVSSRPVKQFFVGMLTRDIALEDAILDLLDNCVDGILRNSAAKQGGTPFKGFWARINFSADEFEIEDNCGGIPWNLHDQAFRMGKLPVPEGFQGAAKQTVGVYGIGMKRAIFKIGKVALIWTQNGKDNYEVEIPDGWMADEEEWDLQVKASKTKMKEDGTHVLIEEIDPAIQERFNAESFKDDLLEKIESHYAVILRKGFKVFVKKTEARPKPITFKFAEVEGSTTVRPYVFRSNEDGVEIFVAVGLREPVPDAESVLEEQEDTPYSASYAGWTVICNDRVVLYCNRDELTGWGTAKVPRYHNQFRAISGVVEFSGNPLLLPTTTTKRGLEFGNKLYQRVLDRMREGTRIFVDFTNWWKAQEQEAKEYVNSAAVKSLSYDELKTAVGDKLSFSKVKVGLQGEQYKPKLPRPKDDSTEARISYSRPREIVNALGEHLLKEFRELSDREVRRRVGEETFDKAAEEVTEKRKSRAR